MSKKKVFIIVAIVMAVAIVAGGVTGYLILTKSSVSVDQFNKQAKAIKLDDGKLEVSDAGEMTNVKKSSIAANGMKYKIYFMEMESEQAAINAFAANREDFNIFEVPDDGITGEYQKGFNYHTYTLVTGGKYYLLSQVKDTFVFACVDREYMEEVNTVVDDLGYLN